MYIKFKHYNVHLVKSWILGRFERHFCSAYA